MPSDNEHSKIIAQAAKESLAPLGIFQKGRSRAWIDDRGWWIINIEFQPSSWSKGSYLNVGAMWLWHEKDYFSFDAGSAESGSRIAGFVEYNNEEQFKPEAIKMADAAKAEAFMLRARFATIHEAARYLATQARRNDSPWTNLAAAIALGYVGETRKAQKLFERIEDRSPFHDWEHRLRDQARAFAETLATPESFKRNVEETVYRTRKLLKLPERTELGLDPEQKGSSQRWKFPWL